MKTNYSIKAFCVTALLGLVAVANAQQNESTVNPVNREMTLEREYDPSVGDANKVNTLPVVKEPEVRKIPIDYAAFTIAGTPDKEISLLPSGRIMTDMLYNKRRGYLNLAGGTYLNLNGDFGYHILSTDKDQLNVFLSHRSTNGNVKYLQDVDDDKVKAKINDNLGGINFRHVFDGSIMKLGATYKYSGFNYYGLPMSSPVSSIRPDMERADRETNQVIQKIGVYAGVESKPEATVGYMIGLNYNNFSQKYGFSQEQDGVTEHTIGALVDFSSAFAGTQRVGIAAKVDFLAYSTPSELLLYKGHFQNHLIGTLTPYYKVEGSNWNIKLGANVMFVTGEFSKIFASPNITADVEVADKTVLYLNAGGEARANSMNEMSEMNRYISPYAASLTSRTWLDATAGLKSGIAPGFWFHIFGGYAITDDDHFFMQTSNNMMSGTDYGFSNYSSLLFSDTKHLFGGVELKYSYQKLFDVSLKGVYNNWDLSTDDLGYALDQAYGRPEMEINAGIELRPIDKLTVALDYYLATGRYANIYGITTEKLKNINELNATVSYTLNDTFGVYGKVNNLLFQKYELYYGYPMQSMSAMVGVNINF